MQRLLSSQGKAVRNRCMHHQILDRGPDLDSALPMFAIIEAVSRGVTMVEDAADVDTAIARIADLLHNWGPRRRA